MEDSVDHVPGAALAGPLLFISAKCLASTCHCALVMSHGYMEDFAISWGLRTVSKSLRVASEQRQYLVDIRMTKELGDNTINER